MTRVALSVDPTTSLVDAASRMHERRVGAVVVLDGGRLVGILTERDVLRAVATGGVDGPVRDAMTHGPETIGPDESAGHAAVLMIHGGFRHLPVVEGDDVIGMISIRDLVRVSVDDEAPRGV
jgi:CBS domain-containing protein